MSTELQDNRNSRRFWTLLIALVIGGVVINLWQRAGEANVSRQQLTGFPERLGNWTKLGSDERFDPATESILRADDYLSRNYASSDGHAASFYVGYYASQRNGATYHSPLNCLPGAGWTMGEGEQVKIAPRNGMPPFFANRYIIQNGTEKQLMIYWYQGRGRSISSEYWGKIYTVIDSIKLRRSDGAMVRVAVPVRGTASEANTAAVEFAEEAAGALPTFVPN
jgi:EpsI family protein